MQHLQILRHLSPGVVEHLVGIVGIHEGHTLKASEDLRSQDVLLACTVHEQGLIHELIEEPHPEVREAPFVGVKVGAHSDAVVHGRLDVIHAESER